MRTRKKEAIIGILLILIFTVLAGSVSAAIKCEGLSPKEVDKILHAYKKTADLANMRKDATAELLKKGVKPEEVSLRTRNFIEDVVLSQGYFSRLAKKNAEILTEKSKDNGFLKELGLTQSYKLSVAEGLDEFGIDSVKVAEQVLDSYKKSGVELTSEDLARFDISNIYEQVALAEIKDALGENFEFITEQVGVETVSKFIDFRAKYYFISDEEIKIAKQELKNYLIESDKNIITEEAGLHYVMKGKDRIALSPNVYEIIVDFKDIVKNQFDLDLLLDKIKKLNEQEAFQLSSWIDAHMVNLRKIQDFSLNIGDKGITDISIETVYHDIGNVYSSVSGFLYLMKHPRILPTIITESESISADSINKIAAPFSETQSGFKAVAYLTGDGEIKLSYFNTFSKNPNHLDMLSSFSGVRIDELTRDQYANSLGLQFQVDNGKIVGMQIDSSIEKGLPSGTTLDYNTVKSLLDSVFAKIDPAVISIKEIGSSAEFKKLLIEKPDGTAINGYQFLVEYNAQKFPERIEVFPSVAEQITSENVEQLTKDFVVSTDGRLIFGRGFKAVAYIDKTDNVKIRFFNTDYKSGRHFTVLAELSGKSAEDLSKPVADLRKEISNEDLQHAIGFQFQVEDGKIAGMQINSEIEEELSKRGIRLDQAKLKTILDAVVSRIDPDVFEASQIGKYNVFENHENFKQLKVKDEKGNVVSGEEFIKSYNKERFEETAETLAKPAEIQTKTTIKAARSLWDRILSIIKYPGSLFPIAGARLSEADRQWLQSAREDFLIYNIESIKERNPSSGLNKLSAERLQEEVEKLIQGEPSVLERILAKEKLVPLLRAGSKVPELAKKADGIRAELRKNPDSEVAKKDLEFITERITEETRQKYKDIFQTKEEPDLVVLDAMARLYSTETTRDFVEGPLRIVQNKEFQDAIKQEFPEIDLEALVQGTFLHDIGKGMTDEVRDLFWIDVKDPSKTIEKILSESKLTSAEKDGIIAWAKMEGINPASNNMRQFYSKHIEYGKRILKKVPDKIKTIAFAHHTIQGAFQKPDERTYDINFESSEAKILNIIDFYDAVRSRRKEFDHSNAIGEVEANIEKLWNEGKISEKDYIEYITIIKSMNENEVKIKLDGFYLAKAVS